ncbi:hypothetical protein ACFQMG_26445, partial [Kitasatospora paranensis]
MSSVLLDPDGTFSAKFEAAVDMAGNVLVVEGLELSGPWADPLIAASLVSSLIDRLADNGSAVVLPRAGADVAGAVLLDEAGALLAGEEFGEDLRIIDTAMAAPEEAAHRVQRLLEERSRSGGRALPDVDDEDAWDDLDGEEGGWTLTARTRAVLRLALDDLAATAWAEAAALGDEGLTAKAAGLFASLPRVTFHQGADWRRQMARTFDDLAADLDAGTDLVPGCTGEEMALHLAICRAEDWPRSPARISPRPQRSSRR